jgi:pyruvate ferredoxin oxidoreductase delta subunit
MKIPACAGMTRGGIMKISLTVQPGTTKENKTGAWRVSRPIFDHEKCIACGTCVRVCPEGCTFPVGERALAGKIFFDCDLDYCKGCGICVAECPARCISMKEEKQ